MTNLKVAVAALDRLLSEEAGKGAEEGLAYEVAAALKAEAQAGGEAALQQLPPLKQALLEYALEQAEEAGLGIDD